ncbi:hypothetical protein [Mesorhizobium sp. M0910]|uniref:hypothetical protein n=1 Tax=Mesorhizobium sp. M0910 TaxID=2957025 RepID=UPI003334E2F3
MLRVHRRAHPDVFDLDAVEVLGVESLDMVGMFVCRDQKVEPNPPTAGVRQDLFQICDRTL